MRLPTHWHVITDMEVNNHSLTHSLPPISSGHNAFIFLFAVLSFCITELTSPSRPVITNQPTNPNSPNSMLQQQQQQKQ
jgi:hypothetical protein